jgi:hypothetical protein
MAAAVTGEGLRGGLPRIAFERRGAECLWIVKCELASNNETEAHMSVEQAILEAVRALPADKQQELLSHANRLRQETQAKKPLKSVRGLWSDLGVSLSAEEIEENQREMWKNFPRDDI